MEQISPTILEAAIDYPTYKDLVMRLHQAGKTTNDENSEAMLHYTEMNLVRMNRLDRKTQLIPEVVDFLQALDRKQIWLVLTEGWCADAAQIVPVLQRMALSSDLVELQLLLRDQHPEVMDAFLTNGARSIPKVIILDAATRDVIASWGPRPSDAQRMMLDAKEQIKAIADEEERKAFVKQLKIDLQKWYNKDKTIHTQQEVAAALAFKTS